MYLARLLLNQSRVAVGWVANPYRVHQRLMMACEGDPRLLFRIEDAPAGTQILVQSHVQPDWRAFSDLPVLACPPEHKMFEPQLRRGQLYRFRLLANPSVKRDGKRHGLLREDEQRQWLTRKLAEAGAEVIGCLASSHGNQFSRKGAQGDVHQQTHLSVLFDGFLRAIDVDALARALEYGVGSAKGYGFGLLSLALANE
jgi:CRISPR system Cascade subunit CasE